MKKQVLIIDDEEKLRGLMARIIALEGDGFEVTEAGTGKAALKSLSQKEADVIFCDVKLPDMNGVDLISAIKALQPLAEVILLTAYGNIPDGVQAIKNGAFDYLTKGDNHNRIIPILYKAVEKADMAKRLHRLELQVGKKYSFENILGKSKAILDAIGLAQKVAATDTTVLLLGETGTGKEVFAQAIHYGGNRRNKPFLAINCAAFSNELLESELFGHKSGSFTGAIRDKKGLFEEAHLGTIFLDELGEMALELQAKLLRVLETGEFLKVGEVNTTKVNVRLIAATNQDLMREIELGHFRSDLYYRLSVFTIILPPLRERLQDIPVFTKNFVMQYTTKMNKQGLIPTARYLEALSQHTWKGNIRELKNVIERSVILADDKNLDEETLPYEISHPVPLDGKPLSAFSLVSIERLHIQKVLNYTKGNKAEAARLLEIGIATLYRKIEEYNIS